MADLLITLLILLIGVALGYGVREYISRRRRAAEWRRKQSSGTF